MDDITLKFTNGYILTDCVAVIQQNHMGDRSWSDLTFDWSDDEAEIRRFFRRFAENHFKDTDMACVIDGYPSDDSDWEAFSRDCERAEEKFFDEVEQDGRFDDDGLAFRVVVRGNYADGECVEVVMDEYTHVVEEDLVVQSVRDDLARLAVTTEEWGNTTCLLDAEAEVPTVREFWIGRCGETEGSLLLGYLRKRRGGDVMVDDVSAEDMAGFERYLESKMPTKSGVEFFADELFGIEQNEDDDRSYYIVKLIARIKSFETDAQDVVDSVVSSLKTDANLSSLVFPDEDEQ